MATINLIYRLAAHSEKEALEIGTPHLKTLWGKVSKALEEVKKDCADKFPELSFEVSEPETEYICAEESIHEEIDGQIVWDILYWMEVKTTSPDDSTKPGFEIDEFDVWEKAGAPKYKKFYEPLYNCDWSSIEPFCGATADSIGDIVFIEFSGMEAVDSYYGGIHFYHDSIII